MLKVPSFSHLLRNTPRREMNEYNELLPYVKEKLLKEKSLNLEINSLLNDKKKDLTKKKKTNTSKEKEEADKKVLNKKAATENSQKQEISGDADNSPEKGISLVIRL